MAESDGQRGRGRPPKDGIAKGIRVELRVNEDERELWDGAASNAGQERSEWIRDTLTKAAKRTVKK